MIKSANQVVNRFHSNGQLTEEFHAVIAVAKSDIKAGKSMKDVVVAMARAMSLTDTEMALIGGTLDVQKS